MAILTGFVSFFRPKFPGLFQDTDWFFKGSKIHINPYTPKISMLILLTAFHTLHIYSFSRTFQDQRLFSKTSFQGFPVLENAIIKFQEFPGFPGLYETCIYTVCFSVMKSCTYWDSSTLQALHEHAYLFYVDRVGKMPSNITVWSDLRSFMSLIVNYISISLHRREGRGVRD